MVAYVPPAPKEAKAAVPVQGQVEAEKAVVKAPGRTVSRINTGLTEVKASAAAARHDEPESPS